MRKRVLIMISPASAARTAGIARYAREHGWYLMIQDRLGYRPLAWDGDGAIVALRSDNETVRMVERLRKRRIPVVDVTVSRPEVSLPRVTSDHVQIGRCAAEHFEERNFRSLAWFSTGWGHVQKLRYAGFTERSPAVRWVVADALPRARKDSYAAFLKWMGGALRDAPKPLGVLAYDEADAARVLDVAERIGLAVPEELAILSIGNDRLICENQAVPLSSIDQNLEQGGYEAARLLDRLMNGEPAPRKPILVPPAGVAQRRSTDIMASRDPLVREALAYIEHNLSRPFGVPQISEALGTTRNVLAKRFRADLRRSIADEVMRQRLAAAKIMLRNSERTVRAIAEALGFSSPSHLTNTFRARTGMTPREFRMTQEDAPGGL